MVMLGSTRFASATEKGISVYSVGVETVMTGVQPDAGKTMVYEYEAEYSANEFDNANDASAVPQFKIRVFATAFKVTHNRGIPVLGGMIVSKLSVPLLYEQLHVTSGKFTKYSLRDISIAPMSIAYNKGAAHWYYEADLYCPGATYTKSDVVNIGQHNFGLAGSSGVTWLPDRARREISSRFAYIFNGPNHATGYHSGNEFVWEYNADQSISKKFAVGLNGYFYQQITDDRLNGMVYEGGFRGRDLAIGPQVRYLFGQHSGLAFKYHRDTLVENKSRGNAFWFQICVPMRFRHIKPTN
jgi:hypothetical protein